jgi:hypothetical protein
MHPPWCSDEVSGKGLAYFAGLDREELGWVSGTISATGSSVPREGALRGRFLHGLLQGAEAQRRVVVIDVRPQRLVRETGLIRGGV